MDANHFMSHNIKIHNKEAYIFFILLLFSGLFLFLGGCRKKGTGQTNRVLTDVSLESYRLELLDIAFDVATAIPVHPHIKDRSLAQEKVVTTCIALKLVQRADQYSRQIENWRQGLCLAQLAHYCARQGELQEAQDYVAQATVIAAEAEDWRRDRIRAWIAKTHLILGRTEQADSFSVDLSDSEAGEVTQARAEMSPIEDFDAQVEVLDTLIATGEYDKIINALRAYVRLLDRFYTNPERRQLIQSKIPASWEKIPPSARITLLIDQMEIAQNHDDPDMVRQYLQKAYEFLEVYPWRPEERLPIMAELVRWRFRIGEDQQARSDAEVALARFTEQGQRVVNIYKAEALYPMAETYHIMGNTTMALQVYQQAIEAALENPNSRPRAEDIAAICCSMALHSFEPDSDMWQHLQEIRQGLGDPW